MSWSSRRTRPETRAPGTTSCKRLSARRKVDLPHPDGPMRAVTCLGSTVMLTSARAWNDPNQALRPSMSMRLAIAGSRSGKPIAAGQEAGDHGQQQHDGDQRKGTGPRTIDGDGEGRPGLGENEQRQARLGTAERVRANSVEAEGGEQQGRRLARDPGD